MRRLREKCKLNNSGVGLVMVIVAIGMILILVSVLMSISLLNYQMKVTEKKSKENFYSAEQVLDEIHAGLESVVSRAAEDAYTDAIVSYSAVGESERVKTFRNTYLSNLRSKLRGADGDNTYVVGAKKDYYNQSSELLDRTVNGYQGLCRFLDKTFAKMLLGKDEEGRTLKISYCDASGKSNDTGVIDTTEEGLVLRNLCVEYTDEGGYYSKIQTDIVIQFPNISLTSGGSVSNFFDYALVADNSIVFEGGAQDVNVTASVSAGKGGITIGKADGSESDSTVTFKKGDQLPRIVSAGPIVVNYLKTLNITADQVWATGITVNGKTESASGWNNKYSTRLVLDADTYITDDLTLKGHYISAELSGKYYGYGSSSSSSDGSSAIILNCANSELNLTEELTDLLLEGNAYIDATSIDKTAYNSDANVLLGTSLASKVDQIAFLVPAECLGDGSSTNPIVGSDVPNGWDTVNYDAKIDLFEGKTLSEILKECGLTSIDDIETKPFTRTSPNNGTLTYLYLYFDFGGNEEAAAKYYRIYMEAAENKIESYLANYNNKVLYTESATDKTSKGNLLTVSISKDKTTDETTASMNIISDSYSTLETDEYNTKREQVNQEVSAYKKTYELLKAKLTTNSSLVSTDELNYSVYYNEVITDNLDEVTSPEIYPNSDGKTAIIANNESGDAVEVGAQSRNQECALVIASGDVIIKGNFSGTILAGGTITVDTTCGGTIKSDSATVTDLLQCTYTATDAATGTVTTTTIAQQYLKDGDSYAINITATTNGEATVDLESIIKYINWNKE